MATSSIEGGQSHRPITNEIMSREKQQPNSEQSEKLQLPHKLKIIFWSMSYLFVSVAGTYVAYPIIPIWVSIIVSALVLAVTGIVAMIRRQIAEDSATILTAKRTNWAHRRRAKVMRTPVGRSARIVLIRLRSSRKLIAQTAHRVTSSIFDTENK